MYIRIAEALEDLDPPGLAEEADRSTETHCYTVSEVLEVAERAYAPSASVTNEELTLATQLVRGHSSVEIPGAWNQGTDTPPDPIVLPEPRSLADFVTAPCKHECNLLRQSRVAKQAFRVFNKLGSVKQALMRATAGECGRDSAHCARATVEAVAKMDRPGPLAHDDSSEATLFCAATLHRFGLPYDYPRLSRCNMAENCPYCSVPLWNPSLSSTVADRIFVGQCHSGRCGGDGRRLQAHEVMKMVLKRLVLSNASPAGCAFPPSSIMIEPPHLRLDMTRPGDIYACGRGIHRKDSVMDIVIASALQNSCLSSSTKSTDGRKQEVHERR